MSEGHFFALLCNFIQLYYANYIVLQPARGFVRTYVRPATVKRCILKGGTGKERIRRKKKEKKKFVSVLWWFVYNSWEVQTLLRLFFLPSSPHLATRRLCYYNDAKQCNFGLFPHDHHHPGLVWLRLILYLLKAKQIKTIFFPAKN